MTPYRTLDRYPGGRARMLQLVLIVVVTSVTFYEIYLQGGVSPLIIADYSIPLSTFVLGSILGNAAGAAAAWATGAADRVGRVNLILAGAATAAVVVGVLLPLAPNIGTYLLLYTVLNLVGGVVLVATSALARDFSPQMGRATAMGVWTLGPSLGSLLVSATTNRLLPSHPDWQFHFRLAGVVGAVTVAIGFFLLRELSPTLRHQVVVSVKDAEAAERQAARGDEPPARLRTMWVPALVLPAIGISLFLMFYVTRVGFFVLYFVTNFGYSTSKANGLASWYWVASAVALLASGLASDRLGVRKPVMAVAAVVSIGALGVFATMATRDDVTYGQFLVLLVVLAASGSTVSAMWLTLFSENVERLDPRSIARGMAVYGTTLRVVVVMTLVGFMSVVSAPSILVDSGPQVAALSQKYGAELATLARIDTATLVAVQRRPDDDAARLRALRALSGDKDPEGALDAALAVPADDLTYLQEHGAEVSAAVQRGPGEWERWWWACFAGQLLLLPLVLTLRGPWRRRSVAEGPGTADEGGAVERPLRSASR